MEARKHSFGRWWLVPLFALLGLGLLGGSASAQEEPEDTDSPGIAIARQTGDNNVTVNQTTEVKSGDSVANSQITGVVGDGSVQNDNISLGNATATSGEVNATVNSTVNVGPSATVSGGDGGGGVALASQTGNNTGTVNQHTVVASGDCVVNSQVTGVVGGGDVENTNLALGDGQCVSGNVNANVNTVVNIGPSATVVRPDPGLGLADLRLEKEGVPDASDWFANCPVNEGSCSIVTFDSTVTNDGPDQAQNVVFLDPAPEGWVVESVDVIDGSDPGAWDCTIVDNMARCENPEMQPDDWVQIRVRFRQDGNEPATDETVTNTSFVQSDTPDPDPTNNFDSDTLQYDGSTWK